MLEQSDPAIITRFMLPVGWIKHLFSHLFSFIYPSMYYLSLIWQQVQRQISPESELSWVFRLSSQLHTELGFLISDNDVFWYLTKFLCHTSRLQSVIKTNHVFSLSMYNGCILNTALKI